MLFTPSSAKRLPKSAARCSVTVAQPSIAAIPSLASIPTIICPANSRQASRTKAGFLTAAVPIITSVSPKARYFSMVAKSRIPPPSWTGISAATAASISRMAGKFFGSPAKAPFKSTKCSRLAPCCRQCEAISAGWSENTVASSIRPWRRRTQLPSFKSIAGISSMAVLSDWQERPSEKCQIGFQTACVFM